MQTDHEILAIPDGIQDGTPIGGVAYAHNIESRTTRTGKPFVTGNVVTPDGTWPFRQWDTESLDPGVYRINGKWNVYNGSGSIVIDRLEPAQGYHATDFFPTRYDAADLRERVNLLLKQNVTPKGIQLFNLLVNGDAASDVPSLAQGFTHEFAAIWHHDNVPLGLLAHSYKTCLIATRILEDPLRSFHEYSQDWKDVVIVGALLHDLGKALEYRDGEMSPLGQYLSHRTLMVMRAEQLKDRIMALYGDLYYDLVSIFAQHHGPYEETPRTLAAVLVHLADDMDAKLTSLDEAISDATGPVVKALDFKITPGHTQDVPDTIGDGKD
ncbi:MAG: HD domain-containing protein [Bifidobacterium sp.]|nr:HD domain-containing protein [Bifidobacterium sp.]